MPLAVDASLCYLQLYRDLQWFQDVDRPVADAVLAVLRRHTAYLRPETVVLSLALGAADTDQRQAELWQQTSSPNRRQPSPRTPSCVSKATCGSKATATSSPMPVGCCFNCCS